jgi:hypothetical protein
MYIICNILLLTDFCLCSFPCSVFCCAINLTSSISMNYGLGIHKFHICVSLWECNSRKCGVFTVVLYCGFLGCDVML